MARTPLFVLLLAVFAAAMLVPAAFAGLSGDDDTARPFFYGSIVFLVLAMLLALATQENDRETSGRGQLVSLLGAFTLLPVILALPVQESVPDLPFRDVYFEMVSSITTTGATLFDTPASAPPAVHLWRALVGWLGGLLMWVAAISILAPLRLGGFEMMLTQADLNRDASLGRGAVSRQPLRRTLRHARDLIPVYSGLTLALWIGLLVSGEAPLVAVCHAMSVMATSGISPVGGVEAAQSRFAGEVLMVAFMVFAITRRSFSRHLPGRTETHVLADPELRVAGFLALAVPLAMYLHHFVVTGEIDDSLGVREGFRAFWGGFFTTVSFLSTTGFVSQDWAIARSWSVLTTPGLILVGLALIGGGVATTAGGVKLLRVYALYKHGQLEMDRLIHPHQVATLGNVGRRINVRSAYIAWLSFMIFALSVSGVMLSLSLAGVDFETATVLTVAMLSTTGPLTEVAADAPIAMGAFDGTVQMILCAAMVLGRLETLAIIALLNPAFWRS